MSDLKAQAEQMWADIQQAVRDRADTDVVIVVTFRAFRDFYLLNSNAAEGWVLRDKVIDGQRHTYVTIDDRQVEIVKDKDQDVPWRIVPVE